MAEYPQARGEQDEFLFELKEAGATVWRRKGLVTVFVVACLAAALAFLTVAKPDYLGTAQVLLDPRGLNVTENDIVPRPPSSEVNDAIIETQVRLLTSDAVLKRVADDLDLRQDPEFNGRPSFLGRLREAVLGPRADVDRLDPAEAVATRLRRQITVQRDGKSFVVTVGVRARAADKAARIANAITTVFITELEKRRRDIVVQARDAMSATLTGQRDRVAKAEDAVERYKQSISVVDSDGRQINTTRLSELNSQILTARASARTLAARLQQLEALKRAPDSTTDTTEAVDSQLLTQLRTSRADLARQLDTLRNTLGPRHPQVGEMDAQVKSVSRAVAQEIGRLVATAQGDYKAALAREQGLSRDLARMESTTGKTNAALVELRQLDREALAQRSVYEKFLGRERELREQESVGGTNATVVTAAKPSPDTIGLRPPLLLAAALMLGLLLGSAAAIAFERGSGRVYSAERLAARSGLRVLGILPMAKPRLGDQGAIASLLAPSRGTATSRAIYRVTDGLDATASRQPAILLVLSASDGPFRPIISSNIVLAEAERGRRALLIEADASNRQLAWLTRRSGAENSMMSCAVEGYPPFNATIAGRAGLPLAPSGSALGALGDYDSIVIDADCARDENRLRRLADAATAILIVTQSGVTTFAEIRDLTASLTRNAEKVLGALVVVPGRDVAVPTATTVAAVPIRSQIRSSPNMRGELI